MFELRFGETEGKILRESFHIAPYGLVQRACRHPVQVCQVGIHHNLLPRITWIRDSIGRGVTVFSRGFDFFAITCLSSTTSASLSPSPSAIRPWKLGNPSYACS